MGRRRVFYDLSSDSDSEDDRPGRKKKKKVKFMAGQPLYTRLIVSASFAIIAASAVALVLKQLTWRSSETMVCTGSSSGESSTDKFFECDVPSGYSLQNSVGKVPVRLDKVINKGGMDPRLVWILMPLGALIAIFLPGVFYYLLSARKLRVKEKKVKERRERDRADRDRRHEPDLRDYRRKGRYSRYYDYSESDSDDYFSDSSLGSESDYYY